MRSHLSATTEQSNLRASFSPFAVRSVSLDRAQKKTWFDTVFALSLVAVFILAKVGTLNTPYYWDEGIYAKGASFVFLNGLQSLLPGLHPPDLFAGHPPLIYGLVAGLWLITARTAMVAHLVPLAFAAMALVFIYLLGRDLYGRGAGVLAAIGLFLSPMFFAQSCMFLADLPVMSVSLACIYFALRRRYFLYVLCATCMLLIKETGLVVIAAIAIYQLCPGSGSHKIRRFLMYGAPCMVSLGFMLWQYLCVGKPFFITGPRAQVRLIEMVPSKVDDVFNWLLLAQGKLFLTGTAIAGVIFSQEFRKRSENWLFLCLVFAFGVCFSIITQLPRYTIPTTPLLYLLASGALFALVKKNTVRMFASSGAVVGFLFILLNDPSWGSAELNMRYLDVVSVHRAACEFIEDNFPSRIITVRWPHTWQMKRQLFGYVKHDHEVQWLSSFSRLSNQNRCYLLSCPGSHESEQDLAAFANAGHLQLVKEFRQGCAVARVYKSDKIDTESPIDPSLEKEDNARYFRWTY